MPNSKGFFVLLVFLSAFILCALMSEDFAVNVERRGPRDFLKALAETKYVDVVFIKINR